MALTVTNPYDSLNSQKTDVNLLKGVETSRSTNKKAGQSLDMTDFLTLMVAMFQNQDIDNPADTSEMMTMMVNMSVVQAITDISQLISDSTNMTYGASLIGKEVTIGVVDGLGKVKEIVGTVTGTGQMDGKQVVFIGDDTYLVSDIMGVGRMPSTDDKKDDTTTDDSTAGDSTETVPDTSDEGE